MNVGAVVVTYNRKALLIECIDALIAQTYKISCIFIVDNASSDGTDKFLEERGYLARPDITYIKLSDNIGGAGGFYHGIKGAHERGVDWIWVMDDDSEPALNALQAMIARVNTTTNVGILAPLVTDREGNIDFTARGFLCFENIFKNMFRRPLKKDDYKEVTEIGFASFVGPIISRNLIAKIGLPNPDFFIYHDDVDYSIRAYKCGYRTLLVPNSVIVHKDARYGGNMRKGRILWKLSSGYRLSIDNYWRMYYSTRNLIYLCRKYQTSRLKNLFEYLIWALKILGGVILYDAEKLERIMLIFRAFIDGFNCTLGKKIDPSTWRKRLMTRT